MVSNVLPEFKRQLSEPTFINCNYLPEPIFSERIFSNGHLSKPIFNNQQLSNQIVSKQKLGAVKVGKAKQRRSYSPKLETPYTREDEDYELNSPDAGYTKTKILFKKENGWPTSLNVQDPSVLSENLTFRSSAYSDVQSIARSFRPQLQRSRSSPMFHRTINQISHHEKIACSPPKIIHSLSSSFEFAEMRAKISKMDKRIKRRSYECLPRYYNQEGFHNEPSEYDYHQLISIVAKEVSTRWKTFINNLLRNITEEERQDEIQLLEDTHTCKTAIIIEFLWRWKQFFASDHDRQIINGILTVAAKDAGVTTWKKLLNPKKVECNTDNACVDDDILLDLASSLGNEWINIGQELGIQEKDVHISKNKHEMKCCIFTMLIQWKEKDTGAYHLQRTKLINALIQGGRKDLADRVEHQTGEKIIPKYDPEELFDEFQQRMNRIGTPRYIIMTQPGNKVAKIYIDIEKGSFSEAETFCKKYFMDLMEQHSIVITEQVRFDYVNDPDDEDLDDYAAGAENPPSSTPSKLHSTVQSGSCITTVKHTNLTNILKDKSIFSIDDIHTRYGRTNFCSLGNIMFDEKNRAFFVVTAGHIVKSKQVPSVNEFGKEYLKNVPEPGEWKNEKLPFMSEQKSTEGDKIVYVGNECTGGLYKQDVGKSLMAVDIVAIKPKPSFMHKDIVSLMYRTQDEKKVHLSTFTGPDDDLHMKKVQKYGRTTLTTFGYIITAKCTVTIGDYTCRGAFLVKACQNRTTCFAQGGDSGALVIGEVEDGKAVVYGLCFRTCKNYSQTNDDGSKSEIGEVTICVRINHSLDYLREKCQLNLSWWNKEEFPTIQENIVCYDNKKESEENSLGSNQILSAASNVLDEKENECNNTKSQNNLLEASAVIRHEMVCKFDKTNQASNIIPEASSQHQKNESGKESNIFMTL